MISLTEVTIDWHSKVLIWGRKKERNGRKGGERGGRKRVGKF